MLKKERQSRCETETNGLRDRLKKDKIYGERKKNLVRIFEKEVRQRKSDDGVKGEKRTLQILKRRWDKEGQM